MTELKEGLILYHGTKKERTLFAMDLAAMMAVEEVAEEYKKEMKR